MSDIKFEINEDTLPILIAAVIILLILSVALVRCCRRQGRQTCRERCRCCSCCCWCCCVQAVEHEGDADHPYQSVNDFVFRIDSSTEEGWLRVQTGSDDIEEGVNDANSRVAMVYATESATLDSLFPDILRRSFKQSNNQSGGTTQDAILNEALL
jgi:hypothetical protein